MQIQTVDGDLLDQNVDVIVNAWNRNFIPWWLLLTWVTHIMAFTLGRGFLIGTPLV